MSCQPKFRKTVLAQAVAVAATGLYSVPGWSQDDATTEIEEIVVTGIRGSLASSIAAKENSDQFIEAVSAEDIGKLPDVSIAESLSRLPGVAAQRVNGRAQVISIRGMGPDFATTLLNGRPQASSGDNRAFEFDQFPSELINGAVIYKTADAGMPGMGLSGTVDLKAIRPLDHGEQTIVMNIRREQNGHGEINSDVSSKGWRGSVSYVDQFADGTIGIALGYAHTDTPGGVHKGKSWWFDRQGASGDAFVLLGQEVVGVSRSQERDGYMGVIEWRPDDNNHTLLDVYYSEFEQEEITRGVYWFSTEWTGSSILPGSTANWGGVEVLQSGTVTDVEPVLRNDFNTRDDEVLAVGLDHEHIRGNWVFNAGLSYSRSERDEQVAETYVGLPSPDDMQFALSQNDFNTYTPGMDYTDVDQLQLGDPAPWGGWGHDGAIRFPVVEEEVDSYSFDAEYDLQDSGIGNLFSRVTAGVNFTSRNKEKDVFDNDLFLKNDRAPVNVDSQHIVDPVDLSFGGIQGGSISFDVPTVIDTYYDVSPILNNDRWNKAWNVDEEVTTLFVNFGIETELFGKPLFGDIGIQYVDTDQSSSGFSVPGGGTTTPSQRTVAHSYSDLLPSLNLKLQVAENQYLRLAAGKTMARPRMDEMRASTVTWVGITGEWSGNGGNPLLEPWRADAFDVGYEFYFGSTSYVGVSYFYKDLESYIYNDANEFDFTGLPNDSLIEPISNIGLMTQPVNGQGGNVKGTELSFALDSGLIDEDWAGLGLVGSFSWTDSSIEPDGPGSTTTLPGLSDEVRSLTAYYERDGFSFRISQRYRSEFRGEVVQLFATRGFTEIEPESVVDAQISYTPQSGALEGTTFTLQAYNLTNEPYRTTTGPYDGVHLPELYEEFGTQYLLGVSYKF